MGKIKKCLGYKKICIKTRVNKRKAVWCEECEAECLAHMKMLRELRLAEEGKKEAKWAK